VAGNVLMLITVHGARYRSGARYLSVCLSVCLSVLCLQMLNSFNISVMDEAMLFKFGKWIEYGRMQLRGKKFP